MWCLFLKRHRIAGVFGQKPQKGAKGCAVAWSTTRLRRNLFAALRTPPQSPPRKAGSPQTRKDFWPLKGAKSGPTPEPPRIRGAEGTSARSAKNDSACGRFSIIFDRRSKIRRRRRQSQSGRDFSAEGRKPLAGFLAKILA